MIAAFSITPLGAGDSVGDPVAAAVRLVRASGLPNETNAMFTNVEGDWDEVMALIKACVEEVGRVAPRVSLVIKIDHRPGMVDGLHTKVARIEDQLGGGAAPRTSAPAAGRDPIMTEPSERPSDERPSDDPTATSGDDLDRELADVDERIVEAQRAIATDPELNRDDDQKFYESGSERPGDDDQTIAPPG